MGLKNFLLLLATVLLALSQSEARTVRVRWNSKKGISVALPKGKGYSFNGKALKVRLKA